MFAQSLFFSTLVLGALAASSSTSVVVSSLSSQAASTSSFAAASGSATPAGPIQAQTSVKLFIGPDSNEAQYAVSIVNIDSCTTTVGMACVSGKIAVHGVGAIPCNPEYTALATYGPDFYQVSTAAAVDGVTIKLVESCSLDGTSSAVCSVSASAKVGATSSATKTTSTLSAAQIIYSQVPVTAGANKIPSDAKCTGSSGSGGSSSGAAPQRLSHVYKVVVVPAAALLAGALI